MTAITFPSSAMSIRSGLWCFYLRRLGERELDAFLGVSGRAFIMLTQSSTAGTLGKNEWVLWGHERWLWDHKTDEMKMMGTLVSFALMITVRTHFWVLVPFCLKSFHPAFLLFFFFFALVPYFSSFLSLYHCCFPVENLLSCFLLFSYVFCLALQFYFQFLFLHPVQQSP